MESLVAELASEFPVRRRRAREALVARRSSEVTTALVNELTDPRVRVRWEAAKALAALVDPVSSPALVQAMEDDDEDVRWLAADALVRLGTVGLRAVLSALLKRAGSVDFCRAARHVLRASGARHAEEIVEPVLAALDESEPGVAVPPAAYHALMELKLGREARF